MFGRKTTALQLYGPTGIKKLAAAMLQFFDYDIHIRRDLVEHLPAAGATIRTHVVREGVVYDDGQVRVTAFDVEHPPVKPAFGYRFESGGNSIVITGDMRPNPNLIRYAKGADILVSEAYLPEWFDKVDTPEVAARLKAYHTTPEQAGEMATAAGVKTLVLTHLVPPGAEETFRQRAQTTFKGRVVVGHDLMTVSTSEERNASDHP
jgi:ribonuclease Z